MKFSQFLLRESTASLESALKAIRTDFRKPNNGIDQQGKKDGDKILDTLLASVSDQKTFSRYYDKFQDELPNAMEFIVDDLLNRMKVDNIDQLFAKVYGIAESVRPFKKGDKIKIKKEWQDRDDDKYEWFVVDDEEKGKVTISPKISSMRIQPTQIVMTDMIELDT